jgi:hypothetical protein
LRRPLRTNLRLVRGRPGSRRPDQPVQCHAAGGLLHHGRARRRTRGRADGRFDSDGIDADFFPDGRWKSILVVNIGLPGENPWFGRLPRLSQDNVIRWT